MVNGARSSRPPRSCPTATSSSSAAFPAAVCRSAERYNPIRGTWSKIAGLPRGIIRAYRDPAAEMGKSSSQAAI